MAFIQRMQLAEDEDESDLLMVSHSVGANAANWWTDIQLVQYLIGSIYFFAEDGAGDWSEKMTKKELDNLPDPNKEYKSLTKTANLIRRFQTDSVKQGAKVYVDGVIDRAKSVKSSISKTYYTILLMNYYFSSAVNASQITDNWIQWTLDDPELPKLLKAQLQTNVEV